MRVYAIGDIHGYFDELKRLHDLIEADRKTTGDQNALVVHLGDLVDRGPQSRQIVDYMIKGQADAQPWICLRGNHEHEMLRWLASPHQRDPRRPNLHWLHPAAGGRQTLASYGIDASETRDIDDIHRDAVAHIPKAHVTFAETLKTSHQMGDVFFCHAGIRPGIPLDQQDEDDLIWIRDDFLIDPYDHGALIVHGHTPVERIEHHGNHLNIDTGAAWGKPASAVVIEDGKVFALSDVGRTEVVAQR